MAHALAIEVGVYLLLPRMATSRGAAWRGVFIGALLNLKMGIVTETYGDRYATFLPCLLPFAVGSLVCQYRAQLERWRLPWTSSIGRACALRLARARPTTCS